MSNTITEFESAISMCSVQSIDSHIPKLKCEYYSLKEVATGGSFPTKGYSGPERGAMEHGFSSMTTFCHRLIFEINRSKK